MGTAYTVPKNYPKVMNSPIIPDFDGKKTLFSRILTKLALKKARTGRFLSLKPHLCPW